MCCCVYEPQKRTTLSPVGHAVSADWDKYQEFPQSSFFLVRAQTTVTSAGEVGASPQGHDQVVVFFCFYICVMESDHGNRTHEITFRVSVRITEKTPAVKGFCFWLLFLYLVQSFYAGYDFD